MKLSSRLLTAGAAALLAAGPAYSQNRELLRLNADVLQLSQQVKQLQLSVDEKTATITSLVEKIADQMNTIQSNLTTMSRSIEDVQGSNDKTAGELRTLVGDLGESVNLVNEGLTSVRTQINSVAQQLTAQATAEPLERPEDTIRTAASDKYAGNYDLAIEGYREFLTKFPNHPRVAEVQFEIGDSYFGAKKFDQAVLEYDLFLQKYSTDDRTRSALYKKGLAHVELNQIPEAQAALARVQKDFPNTPEAVNATAKLRELAAPRRRQ